MLEIAIQQLQVSEQEILDNFIDNLKSPVTKHSYQKHIEYYLTFCQMTKLSELLAITEPDRQIRRYIKSLQERNLSTRSINTMLYAIFHFYIYNDVILNTRKIISYVGQPTLKQEDRPYTHDEIKKILDVSDLRMKVIIGLMYSAGLRIGAIADLKLRHLQKIEMCYKVTVYEGSKEMYYSFCTPECASFIQNYLEYRSTNGEQLTENSYLIRNQFDINDLEQIRNKSKGIQTGTLKVMLNTLLRKAGLRTVDRITPHKRKEVAMAHGMRKLFCTQLVKAKLQTEYRWFLEGHKMKGNDESYVKIEDDINEMFQQYKLAINNLTVSDEYRLKEQVKSLLVNKSRIDELEENLKKLESEYKKLKK